MAPFDVARAAGLARSVFTNYGPLRPQRRGAEFHRRFVAPGDLVFDVGAHAGSRIGMLRRIGADVVAVEPQPDLLTVLRLFHGRDPHVRIEPIAVGAVHGEARMHIATRTPTVSTLATTWREEVRRDPRWRSVRWDREIVVPVRTMDELIERHGEPVFCKIDVEGHEAEVLAGLSRPLRALSFEYVPAAVERSVACVDRLSRLGGYRFRPSRGETWRWETARWLDRDEIITWLRALTHDDRSGDVYAVRADPS